MSISEMTESLTGFEEIAVSKQFNGKDMQDLPGTQTIRALIFVYRKRQGDKDIEAYDHAMGLSLKAVMGCFTEEVDEPMPEEPVSAAGEGDSLLA